MKATKPFDYGEFLSKCTNAPVPMKATVFHDIRGGKIFLCIAAAHDLTKLDGMKEASRTCYSIEREVPSDCTPDRIMELVREMEVESGLKLELSEILRQEMGL